MRQPPVRVIVATVAILLGAGVVPVHAFTFFVTGELTTQSTSYTGSGDSTETEAIVELANENLQSYTIDLSELGDGVLDIRWNAPAGKCFELEVPIAYDSVEIFFEWQLGSEIGVFETSGLSSPSLVFTNLTGSASLREQFVFYRDNGMHALAASDLVPGETVRFEAVRFNVGIEAAIDKNYNNLTEAFLRLRAKARQTTSTNTPADAGQWLSLVDKNPIVAPEIAPQDSAVIDPLFRKLKKLKKKLRKLKKKGETKAARKVKKKIRKLKKLSRFS